MNEAIKSKLELFVSNTESSKKRFTWQYVMLKRLAALLYAVENKVIDIQRIQECMDLIKKSTGVLSTFRGNSLMILATLLSLVENKEERLTDTLKVYDMLKAEKFRSSDFLVIAAYQIVSNTDPIYYSQAIKRSKAFYDGLKAQHRFITGHDDYIFSVMLGLSNIDIKTGLTQMEQIYQSLKPKFYSRNGVQALSQVLVLGGNASGSESRILELSNTFREKKLRLDRDYTLSSLGVLALLPVGVDTLVNNVIDVYEYLRTKKGFGSWSITKQELLLLSCSLVAYEYIDQANDGIITTAISTSITNIIIAQQAAMIAAISASTAAAASASN